MPDTHSEQLRSILAPCRAPGNRAKHVVQCHGCFDIVHPGHIRYLRFARSQGDILVVSITGDAAIDKEPQRPYIPQELRAENLAALELVDYVVIDPNPTARDLLDRIRPDVYVKGQEYATSNDAGFLAEREVVESHGGRVIFSSGEVVFSSSRLVGSLSERQRDFRMDVARPADLAAQRLALLCRRHGIDRLNLSDILGNMCGRRILVLGDVAIERYVLCDANTIASESPMMSLKELDRKDYVGGAAVIAAQLAALGAEPILITAL
ncbi:MAG: adenylyltransferase/cytidyltransferase family protein, partial [Phycisphaerae bacterium]